MEGEQADQDCMVVEWSIENFTCWNHQVHDEGILQKIIEIEEKGFQLELYPKGFEGLDEYILVCVYDENCSNNGELSIIDSKGSLLWKEAICNPPWIDDYVMEMPTNLIFKDVVQNIVQDPMFKDVITLRYTIKSLNNYVHFQHTKVDAFDRLLRIPSEILRDPSLIKTYWASFYYRFDGCLRGYSFNLSSVESMVDGIECSFELEKKSLDVSNVVHCYLYVLNSNNSCIRFKEIEYIFAEGESWEFKHTLPNDIIEELSSLLIRFKILYGKGYTDYENYSSKNHQMLGISNILHSSAENYSTGVVKEQPENAVSLLSKELMCLYQDHDFSDFQLRCESVTFPVHKNILSARSPVFKCMLASDMKEATSGCLDIEDLDPHTLGRFLAFLYSGGGGATVEAPLEWEAALKLYYAADKYQVPSLKVECTAVLKDQVSISNVCDILSLADKHQDEMLKLAATDFIWKNYAKVLESKEWESFMLKESLLLCKTLTFLGQKSNTKKRCVVPEM